MLANKLGNPVTTCPQPKARLTVHVNYEPRTAPVEGATVTISGPESRSGITDAAGTIAFEGLTPGAYRVDARQDSGSALVDKALAKKGSADWDAIVAKPPYPAGANKCNLFVSDMANEAGMPVPLVSRYLGFVSYPPLAGRWADSSVPIGDWTVVTDPKPGDVIAERYSDDTLASGHMGIVSYPCPATPTSVTLAAGDDKSVTLELKRRTLSQSAYTGRVEDNDWGWRAGQSPVFRRYSPPHSRSAS